MRVIFILFILNTIMAWGEVQMKYLPGKDKQERVVREWLLESRVLDEAVELVNMEINIGDDLWVLAGEGEDVHYDPQTREIKIPYDFIIEVRERFAGEYEEDWELYAGDALEHTLYHELGHALVDLLNIPVLGKEEDAVDDFGVIMLILTRSDGDDRAISAAELFFMEGEDIEEFTPEDLMDEHSLDDQRGFKSLCMVYGSDPEKYEDIAKDLEMDEERRLICLETFERQTLNWLTLLRPHLKDGILLDNLKDFEGQGEI